MNVSEGLLWFVPISRPREGPGIALHQVADDVDDFLSHSLRDGGAVQQPLQLPHYLLHLQHPTGLTQTPQSHHTNDDTATFTLHSIIVSVSADSPERSRAAPHPEFGSASCSPAPLWPPGSSWSLVQPWSSEPNLG